MELYWFEEINCLLQDLPVTGNKKSCPEYSDSLQFHTLIQYYTLCLASSETDIFFLPLALRWLTTRRPLADAIRLLNPCLFFLFRRDGWNVLFIALRV